MSDTGCLSVMVYNDVANACKNAAHAVLLLLLDILFRAWFTVTVMVIKASALDLKTYAQ